MTPVDLRLDLGAAGSVSARHYPASAPTPRGPRPLLVLAHGAGADQRHRFMAAVAGGLARHGVDVVTFNFLYTERGKRTPDRAPVLEETWLAVLEAATAAVAAGGRLVIGGKSMGGRIASQVLARPELPAAWQGVSGLVLLGYPLHPPNQPAKLRMAHLPSIRVPMLVVQGTRDAFGSREEVAPVFSALPSRVDFEWIDGGDHSFGVPKSAGRSADAVLADICERVAGWIAG